jgi:hypothetical protein
MVKTRKQKQQTLEATLGKFLTLSRYLFQQPANATQAGHA